MLLQDRVCLVTGVSSDRGIGFATTELFARHGAKLAILDSQLDDAKIAMFSARLSQSTGRPVEIIGCKSDLTNAAACRYVVDQALERFGAIDALVHAAGIVAGRPTLEMSTAEFSRMIEVNLVGAFNIVQPVLEGMVARRSGSIVNVSSVAAQRGGGLVGGAHYAASKGGLVSFTKSIAREYGHLGIRANAICPSLIDTPMLDSLSEEQLGELTKAIPLGRVGKPEEIASACLFLASDLSSYITGATIDVNGGLHIH